MARWRGSLGKKGLFARSHRCIQESQVILQWVSRCVTELEFSYELD